MSSQSAKTTHRSDRCPTAGKRVFTIQEANAALPLVRAIVADLVALAREVTERRQRLLALAPSQSRRSADPYQEERDLAEEELEGDARRLAEYVEELRQLGVETRSVTEGLVDFPAVLAGRDVWLCWKLGEPEVAFWHEADAGFWGRQPLAAMKPQRAGQDDASPGHN